MKYSTGVARLRASASAFVAAGLVSVLISSVIAAGLRARPVQAPTQPNE